MYSEAPLDLCYTRLYAVNRGTAVSIGLTSCLLPHWCKSTEMLWPANPSVWTGAETLALADTGILLVVSEFDPIRIRILNADVS